jgi:hypothetical protein
MPKQSMDYSKTIIYKIVCNELNVTDVYVGHTTDFIRLKSQHKSGCNNCTQKRYNFNLYIHINKNGGWTNFCMIEIEKYPCNDNNEARARERYWYETLEASLNTRNPIQSKKEYYENKKQWEENNKERVKEYRKKNYEKNQEKRREYNKQYYQQKKKLSSTNI